MYCKFNTVKLGNKANFSCKVEVTMKKQNSGKKFGIQVFMKIPFPILCDITDAITLHFKVIIFYS